MTSLCPRPRWVSLLDSGDEPGVESVQGYRISVSDGVAVIDAGGEAGAFYADVTIAQLHGLYPDGIPDMVIVDDPAIEWRGVMLDVSRGKVPTLETLELIIERIAALKLNVLQLYLEHTFAHPGHEDAWRDATPYTAADVSRLQTFAAQRHVELIGQQNALGHMERWLEHPRYAPLAALPGGYRSADGGHEPAACIDPALAESFELAAELVTNVAEAFGSRLVHVGLDEPIDLNPAVWDAIFDQPGAPVPWADVDNGAFCVPLDEPRRSQYIDWVRRLRELPALEDRQMLMWADVLAPHPELLAQIPDGVTMVEWGYEASHPFDARCQRIAAAGLALWVAPGTSSWSSMSGRIANMTANVRAAVDAAVAHHGQGVVVCDWGNDGHFQYLPISWPGFVTTAALAWNPNDEPDVVGALARYVTRDDALAAATWRLGHVNDGIIPPVPDNGTLAALLISPSAAELLAAGGMTPAMLDAADVDLTACVEQAMQSHPSVADGRLWADEVCAAASWLRLAISAARARLGWPGALTDEKYAAEHQRLLDEHRRLWLARNRPSGIDRSVVALEFLGARDPEKEDPDGIDHT
jgi:hexosaminidase